MRPQEFSSILIAALTIILLTLTLASSAWAAEYKVIYKFKGSGGTHPYANLVLDAAGNLYGTTYQGGPYGYGTVFELTPNPDGSWTEAVLHTFNRTGTEDFYPRAGLIFDAAGNLYGTTSAGEGPCYSGTAFKLIPNPDGSWSESVIHSFSGTEGESPWAGLIFDASGRLYGTTFVEGREGVCWGQGCGVVFELTPSPDGSWSETVIHSFDESDGGLPRADLILDAAGNLYGTTYRFGAYGLGTVFKLTPNPDGTWTRSTLHAFKGPDGAFPVASLILDAVGNLYGTTYTGGAYDGGTVFKLAPNPDGTWTRSQLHAFKGPDGANPYAGLIFDGAGNFYGTTASGGPYNAGTVFKLAPNPDGTWTRSKLHAFKGPDGDFPVASLILDAAGNLYGTTSSGGRMDRCGGQGCGVVFKITP